MLKALKIVNLLIFIFTMGEFANAACTNVMCSGTIKKIVAMATVQIQFNGFNPAAGLPNCTSPSNVYVTLSKDPDKRKEQYAMLLTAFTTGSSVNIRIIENSVDCEAMYTTIY